MSAAVALATGRYTLVAQRCTVRFTARSLGLAVPGELSVRFGEVTIDDAGGVITAVLDAASFRTRNARRDRDVRAPTFLDVEQHPDIVFTARWAGPGTPVRGHLTVRDVVAEQDVEIVGIDREPRGSTVRARARVDRRAFPVGPARGPIGRYLDVELEIVLLGV